MEKAKMAILAQTNVEEFKKKSEEKKEVASKYYQKHKENKAELKDLDPKEWEARHAAEEGETSQAEYRARESQGKRPRRMEETEI